MKQVNMSEKEIAEEIEQYDNDFQWFTNNYDSLKEKYPDQFVAIWNGKLVGHSQKIESLLTYLKEFLGDEYKRPCIEYVYNVRSDMKWQS